MNLFPHIIVTLTYKCYEWTKDDQKKLDQGGWSVQILKETCEEYGYIFSEGDDSKAPGCGECWCCQPEVMSGNCKYILY